MNRQQFLFSDSTGDAVITVYNVFPGVQLTYHSIHMDELSLDTGISGQLLEIHHCREGRVEQAFADEFFYLMPGDLSVASRQDMVKAYRFPLRHYHGVTIGINLNEIAPAFSQMLQTTGVQLETIPRDLCGERSCFIIRAEQNIEHILSELYTVGEAMREGYIKLKIVELLLVLSHLDASRNLSPMCALPQSHVLLAHQAAAYLAEHMGEHITVPELSRELGVSATHLKTIFRGVYGEPIFSYMRTQKMQAAGQLLIHTEKTVGEIADEFGYANAGKFASAFQAIMGESPRDFRNAHTKLKHK